MLESLFLGRELAELNTMALVDDRRLWKQGYCQQFSG
jgi:hypothetical protein